MGLEAGEGEAEAGGGDVEMGQGVGGARGGGAEPLQSSVVDMNRENHNGTKQIVKHVKP